MPNIGGRYVVRNGKRELVHRTQETEPKQPPAKAPAKAQPKPAAPVAESKPVEEKRDA